MRYSVSAIFTKLPYNTKTGLFRSGSLKTYEEARGLAELWKELHGENVHTIKIHSFENWGTFCRAANSLNSLRQL